MFFYSCKSTERKILSAKSDCNFFFQLTVLLRKKKAVWVHADPFFCTQDISDKKNCHWVCKRRQWQSIVFRSNITDD